MREIINSEIKRAPDKWRLPLYLLFSAVLVTGGVILYQERISRMDAEKSYNELLKDKEYFRSRLEAKDQYYLNREDSIVHLYINYILSNNQQIKELQSVQKKTLSIPSKVSKDLDSISRTITDLKQKVQ